jgi:hypothetical protein
MMNLCSNSEGQRDPKLNEYRQVANRVQGTGRRDRQKIGKRGSGKSTHNGHNGDGDDIFISPTPGSGGNLSTKDLLAWPVQDPDLNSHETSASLPGNTHLWDKNSTDQAPTPSVTPKQQAKYSKGRGEARKNQSRNDGRTGELFSQRLLLSKVLEEEQAQCGKRLAKPKGTGEAPEGQPHSDGKTNDSNSQRLLLSEAPNEEMAQANKSTTELSERIHLSQVPPSFSPFFSSSVSFSDATKRKVGHTVPSAEAPEAPEALGAKNAQKKQTAPHVREQPPTSLDALPGNGTSASSPSGEDTQGPSPVDYNLKLEAEFPPTMVIEMQKNVALRARKTMIGRTLLGRASFKDLQDCLKLHLPTPFITITLLTRGYFEVLFEKEEGARATRKLAAVKWSG